MFPTWNFSPTIEYPLSGDVVQDIETSWFARMRGNPELEYKIITEVWSYGDQLGTLTDALLELAEERGWDDTPALEKLRSKRGEVQQLKMDMKDRLRDRAEQALAHLKAADPEAHARLTRGAETA